MDLYRVCAISYDVEKKCSYLYFINGEVQEVSMTPRMFLEKMCLVNGCSLQGRMDAFKYVMKVQKKVPVLINQYFQCIFFPTHGSQVERSVWLQYKYIKKVTSLESAKCIVHFVDDSQLLVNVGCRVIYKQLKRCREFFGRITCNVDYEEIIEDEVCYTSCGDVE